LVGLSVVQARKVLVAALQDVGALDGEPRAIVHSVKFYEKGERPLEILSSRQWFIKTLEHRAEFIQRGEQIVWHPEHMKVRYDDWVRGLSMDWLISRQRFFGVPFPIWYPLDATGQPDVAHPIVPDERALPVDPQSQAPSGFTEDQRGLPSGFIGEPDVMDTWATSSLTPQLATGWLDDPQLHRLTYPMDLRPQAHEIIRTWLFDTVVRSHLEEDATPWAQAALSGWVLDPDRKKMAKSSGNVITPGHLLDEFGADGVRYWALSARLGTDTAFEPAQMKVGRRLATKVLNAARFVYGMGTVTADAEVTEVLDGALLGALRSTIETATSALDDYDHTAALEVAERFFWAFCDDYVELVKDRAYAGCPSAGLTLRVGLEATLKLLAPFIPFATEEVWSWTHGDVGAVVSIHRTSWPTVAELPVVRRAAMVPSASEVSFNLARAMIGAVRKAKAEAGLSMRSEVGQVWLAVPDELLTIGHELASDLRAAGHIGELHLAAGGVVQARI
jgi:valyl-tRNA synthetase